MNKQTDYIYTQLEMSQDRNAKNCAVHSFRLAQFYMLKELICKSLSVQQQGIATLQNTFNMSQLKAKAIKMVEKVNCDEEDWS